MIGGCYAISGIVLGLSAVLFQADALTATTHTACWCVSFFFASAQCFGALGPVLYGALIGDGQSRTPMFWGYILATVVMLFGALVAAVWGVDAEGKSLEEIAPPLTEYKENGEQITHLSV
jgi:hypothetical protein